MLTNDYDLEDDNQTVTSALADTDGDGLVDDTLPIGVATPVYGTDNDDNIVPAGTITLNPDGTYTYTPALDFTGTVPVEYTITDDNTLPATDSATLTIEVVSDTPNAERSAGGAGRHEQHRAGCAGVAATSWTMTATRTATRSR